MSSTRRLIAGATVVMAVWAAVLIVRPGRPAVAAPGESEQYVLYYTVPQVPAGPPPTLASLAAALLGDDARGDEILQLNAGRVQPDGQALADPAKVNAGWHLVLPWDASGADIRYGRLPAGAAPSGSPSGPPPAGPTGCPTGTPVTSDWARSRLAVEPAWQKTKGKGVTVAVVDSGVDGTLAQFTGRVASGADLVTGQGRGDNDCLGSGTAMAALIAAGPEGGGRPARGIAPEAAILPIRVIDKSPKLAPGELAAAIEIAVSTGATVVALGGQFSLSDPVVARGVMVALQHDVLIVAGAPADGTPPATPGDGVTGALVTVGAIDADNRLTSAYASGVVELVAPGKDVATLGTGGAGPVAASGTHLAVAEVAAAAALVRSANPGLPAVRVKQQLIGTAQRMGEAPDTIFGWGVVDAAAALATEPADPAAVISSGGPAGGSVAGNGHVVVVVLLVVVLVAVAWAVVRLRRRARQEAEGPEL